MAKLPRLDENPKYYVLLPASDEDGNMMALKYAPDHTARSFVEGQAFLTDPNAKPWEKPPSEPIRLSIKKGRETAPLPTFLREPAPIINKAFLSLLRSLGIDNIDVYRAELRYEDGRLASDDYYVFNLIGLVEGDQPGRIAAVDSLTINPKTTRDLLMFRLAENLPTIIIHEVVKRAIEAAAIPLVKALRTEDAAIL